MPNTQKHNLVEANIPMTDIADLISQYDITQIKLHQCAMYEAGDNLAQNIEMADNENLYLSKQEEILSLAATIPLTSEDDVQNILRLWMKEKADSVDQGPSADQLILSVCNHYNLMA